MDVNRNFHTLEDTSNVFGDMDYKVPSRHFSNTSSTYSSQTNQSQQSQMSHKSHQSDQSQGSSVIVNKSDHEDIAKAHLHSNVLSYIKENESDFDANDLFQQRQQRKYIGQSRSSPSSASKGYNFSVNFESSDPQDEGSSQHTEDQNSINFHDNNDANDEDNEDIETFSRSMIGHREPSPRNDKASIFFNDDYEENNRNNSNQSLEVDSEDDLDVEDDDDDDMLLPPSPPRSPPRELDPDKLYGLYDFSGPDPSHCSISRDEPVYLINDQDNYWWLIKKLTKPERIQLLRERHLNNSFDENIEEFDDTGISTDDEDGKVGFVPAECLETYGERLARLNCFKNEELEKSSRDLLETSNSSSADNVVENNKSGSSIGLGSPAHFQKSPDTTLSRSGSILKDSTKQSINKSVTFEDLGVLEMNENSVNDNEEQEFPEHYYDIPEINELSKQNHDPEKGSEVLSDVYPSETPLIINKRKGESPLPVKQKSLSPPIDHDSDLDGEVQDEVEKSHDSLSKGLSPNQSIEVSRSSPNTEEITKDHISISSSPNTPQPNFQTPEAQHASTFNGVNNNDNPDSIDTNDAAFKTPLDPGSAFDEVSGRNLTPRSERLRRTEILDKLNQVTSDIQNELDMEHYNPYYRQGSFLSSFDPDRDSNSYLSSSRGSQINEESSDVEDKEINNDPDIETNNSEDDGPFNDDTVRESAPFSPERDGSEPENSAYEVGSGFGTMNRTQDSYDYDDYDDDNERSQSRSKDFNVTPLTSTNSLNASDKNSTSLADKRKSKPVHDMFVPILGKFDELAEKLAEIDGML